MRKLIAGGLLAATFSLGIVSSSIAASHNPTGQYTQFAECPLSQETITDCIRGVIDSGYFAIGATKVPIAKPVILQGGFEGEGSEINFFGAENGATLSNTPQPVPGGLTRVSAPNWWPEFLQDWFDEEISNGVTGVTSTLELTGPTKGLTDIDLSTENLLFEEGTALGLSAKLHLENPLLGSNCYLGWESNPIQIDLTTATDGNLKGDGGRLTFNKAFTVSTIADSKLVNNSFTVPRAEGCGGLFSFFIDPLVNSVLGLPAEAGANSAVLEGKLQDGVAEAVKKSE